MMAANARLFKDHCAVELIMLSPCLLYTSDAADEEDSVVLFWLPRPIFRSGRLRRLASTSCHILARSSVWWPERPRFSKTIAQ